jgi:hypothetical protein
MALKNDEIMIEDADLLFRNFAGRERDFNSEGDRNFCIMLDKRPEIVQIMEERGWNVKFLKPREDDDGPRPYIQVKVEYSKGRPPRCVLVSSRGRTDLGADEVALLDMADIKSADVILNGYHWTVREGTPQEASGVKAYLKSIYLTINEDELDLKYADLLDAERVEEVTT